MADIKIKVDLSQVKRIADDFKEMIEVALHRIAERGERVLRQEVPKKTHNLEQGVSSEVDVPRRQVRFLVAARAGRTAAEGGLLHLPGGETREIQLRARPAYDYAEAVAKGTGVYRQSDFIGPQGVIRPRTAKALLVPVAAAPLGESFITSGGQTFVLRRYIRGMKPNPYDVRAAKRLEGELPAIFDEVVQAFANQEQLAF